MRLLSPGLLLTGLALPMLAWACFTSERARDLGKEHPDLDFENLAHQMHAQQQIDFTFGGPADCVGSTAGGFACHQVSLAGWLPLDEIGGGANGTDNWGWVHRRSGRMFALMGRSNGVAFVEITDPQDPRYLGNLPRPPGVSESVWSDIKTYQDHAFIVADSVQGHGILVFDLTRLLNVEPDNPRTFRYDARYAGVSGDHVLNRAHNIAINERSGFAYVVGSDKCSGGLYMVNIQQPLSPSYAGCYAGDGYTHDVQCVIYHGPDQRYRGHEICLASNENSLTIVDVTDKDTPELIARHQYDSAYVHQGWLTEDHRYFLLDDELDEHQGIVPATRTLIFDLADLQEAPPPAEYLAGQLSIDHNQYVIGNYVFQANYESGLRILRIDDPARATLSEVAWFDTYPEAGTVTFNGAWSVFPYFGNPYVLVSDINRGLFILRIDDPDIADALRKELLEDRFEL
ncbi:MAG: choice-of-anchor B family protein [Pseudomonadota bacterium]|nr:MAG: choice-of-anchor B family protein [Pseudomonadota bacterium]